MAGEPSTFANRWKRFADWDERPLRLDKFADRRRGERLFAFYQPARSKAGTDIGVGRVIDVMDGVGVGRLRHDRPLHRPLSHRSGDRAGSHGDALARGRADAGRHERAAQRARAPRPRHDAGQARRGRRPALMRSRSPSPIRKMRARKTPGNQAHVTNAKDDPLQLAADAATAVALRLRRDRDDACASRATPGRTRSPARSAPRSGAGARCSSARARRPRSCRSAWPALPPMPRRSRSTAPRRPSSTATTRPGRRPSSPPPMPRAASRCAAPRAPARSC